MDLFQAVSVGMVGAVLALMLKEWKPELSVAVSIATGIFLLFGVFEELREVFSEFSGLMERGGVDLRYFQIVVKIIGISYLAQFGSSICRDSGQSAIAEKIELAGKAAVVSLTLPILIAFLEFVIQALSVV